jgi:hypothetical protein
LNYFTHGFRFLDRPFFLAGTALPDWLSIADRRVRLRARNVLPFADDTGTPAAEIAAGVLQHLADDAWFHKTAAFAVASAELTVLLRRAIPADDGYRPAFLGHILTEILLDSILIERHPLKLADYYAALSRLDAGLVEDAVNNMARRPTDRLKHLIPRFVEERFLADYGDSKRLLFRLNQIMRRVGLSPLPNGLESSIEEARCIVAIHAAGLLPKSLTRINWDSH